MKNTEKQIFTKIWAPTLVSFTNWVLRELQNKGIHKAYFLARDGYMSYLIARKIAKEEQLPIECRLLHCSRYAFRIAEYHLPDSEPFEKICVGGIGVTARSILKRGGLTEPEQEEVYALLRKQGLITAEMDEVLAYSQVLQMKDKIKDCRKLKEYIQNHAEEAYRSTMSYLKQEGLMSGDPFAIVDSGWVGSMQQTLEHLLTSDGFELTSPIEGFYFGLYELPKGVDASHYHTFYFRAYKDKRRKVYFSNCLFEAVVSSPEGMTIGYAPGFQNEFDNGHRNGDNNRRIHWEPIRETEKNLNADRVEGNIVLLEEILKDGKNWRENILTDNEISVLLSRLMARPEKKEAECFGSYLFSDDVLSAKDQRLSEDLSDEELRNLGVMNRYLIMKGIRKGKMKETAWPEGSIVLKGKHISWNLFRLKCYKYLIYIRKNWKK